MYLFVNAYMHVLYIVPLSMISIGSLSVPLRRLHVSEVVSIDKLHVRPSGIIPVHVAVVFVVLFVQMPQLGLPFTR